MKDIITRLIFCALTTILLVGCGSRTPQGIPDLYPTKVVILNGDKFVKNANVFLVPQEGTPAGSWSISGVTDDNGSAVIETSQGDWKKQGVPEGSYSIYITKLSQIEEPEKPADMETNEEAKAAYFAERLKRLEEASKEIPKSLTSATTSGLEIVVTTSGAEETFDVSQAE